MEKRWLAPKGLATSEIRPHDIDDYNALLVVLHNGKPTSVSSSRLAEVCANNWLNIVREKTDENDTRGGRIVGMTTLLMHVISDGWIGFIEEVAVLEDFQRMGIAQALLDWSLQVARAHHCVYVDLTSSPKRKAARHLYTSVGFVERETGVYRLNLL